MEENLVGYLLNALDEPTRQEVEAYLRDNAEGQRKLALLRRALQPLAADGDGVRPPADLAVRTLGRVAEQQTRDLPHAPTMPLSRGGGGRPFWRRADVLVAASLLITLVGLAAPALLQHVYHSGRVAECANNLREIFTGLKGYHDNHGRFPSVKDAPQPVAGMIVPMLAEAGYLKQSLTRCPATNEPESKALTVQHVSTMSRDEFTKWAPILTPGYGYSLGYYDERGRYIGPRQHADVPDHMVPLMADRPPADGQPGNSPNHDGKGQNILFQDGHVHFSTTRNAGIGGDDIYLNKGGKVAAGHDPHDAVVGHSAASP